MKTPLAHQPTGARQGSERFDEHPILWPSTEYDYECDRYRASSGWLKRFSEPSDPTEAVKAGA